MLQGRQIFGSESVLSVVALFTGELVGLRFETALTKYHLLLVLNHLLTGIVELFCLAVESLGELFNFLLLHRGFEVLLCLAVLRYQVIFKNLALIFLEVDTDLTEASFLLLK